MGLFKSHKDEKRRAPSPNPAAQPPSAGGSYQPPSGPPPGYRAGYAQGDQSPSGPPPGYHASYAQDEKPPLGPPPGHHGGSSSYDQPPPGPPPRHHAGYPQDEKAPLGPPPGHHAGGSSYDQPPPGPPPGRHAGYPQDEKPPLGPPPGHHGGSSSYDQPPAGPPPGQGSWSNSDVKAPLGPPPGHGAKYAQDEKAPLGPPPSYYAEGPLGPAAGPTEGQYTHHDWQSVPDTALLPPPPSLANEVSPTGNATESDGRRADQFCKRYPLRPPGRPTQTQAAAVRDGAVMLQQSAEFRGRLQNTGQGLWSGITPPGGKDCMLLSAMPLYFAEVDSPLRTGQAKTCYFEVKVGSIGAQDRTGESSIAIGFCAVPYPTWRMPGWERASIGVHSDDGRRYVCDPDGGVDFTSPIRAGETVGLGIRFAPPPRHGGGHGPGRAPQALDGEVIFTRNGKRAGGWNIHEEMDSDRAFGIQGLEGGHDLFAAVGLFGNVGFEAIFHPKRWLYHP